MVTTSLKIAIVGCGKIADAHVEEIAKLSGTALVAVCDRERLMAEQLAVRYTVPAYYDEFDGMLEKEKPDVVHVTTPPQSHVALAMTALKAGCHVYVEKPLAPTFADTRRIIAAAEGVNKKLTVGYTYYYDPPAEALRRMVAQGVIGDPVHIESYYGYDLGGTFGRAITGNPEHWVHSLPGKIFQNNLDHALNKITEFIPEDNPTISAKAFRRANESFGDMRDELMDELRVVLIGKKTSAYVTFTCGVKPVGHFMRVYGTRCAAHVDFVSRAVIVEGDIRIPTAIGRALAPFGPAWRQFRAGGRNIIRFARSDFHYFAGMNRLLALFYEAIRTDGAPPIAYADIARVAAMQEEIYSQIAAPAKVRA
jgi:predicted dehydrogenase